MLNKQKIILMTKFAVYDKNFGNDDRKKNSYFTSDYVYMKNRWTRLFSGIGALIALFFYWLHKIVVENVDILALDINQTLIRCMFFIGAVMVFYTIIGSVIAFREHSDAKRRLNNYFLLISKMEKIDDKSSEGV